ncbi:MAG: hypothetical protein L3J75_05360 [Methylococcaceae bacterium]|nr:hypothetical protein [Methylococcaceae bacterium]
MLREDEKFVARALCEHFSGSWQEGEDPPDIYISYDEKKIAVEISTLTQHVINDAGKFMPRLSQDTSVIRVCEELDLELRNDIPDEFYIIITLFSPIIKARKFKELLKKQIILLARRNKKLDKVIEIYGVEIRVHIVSGRRESGKKIIGIIPNKNSSANITDNVRYIFEQRISEKSIKCRGINHRPLWLALFNDYWLADFKSYQEAFRFLPKKSLFDKIFIIDGSKKVYEIKTT